MNTSYQAMHPSGHTMRDAEALEAAGIDPVDRQSRDWATVACWCGTATRHLSATCDDNAHYQPPAAVLLKESLKDFEEVPISIT